SVVIATKATGKASLLANAKGYFYSAFGPSANWDFEDDGNGNVVFNSTGEQYFRYLTYMNRLYAEGLLHQEYLTLDRTARDALAVDGILFMASNGANLTAADFASGKFDLDQLTLLTSEYDDTLTLISNSTQMGTAGGFVITEKCEYKKELAQCFDILYAKAEVAPGTGLYCAAGHYGPEGLHWKLTDDTKMEFTFIFNENLDNEPDNTYTFKRDIYYYGPFLYTFKNVIANEESNNRARQIGYINNLNPYVIVSFPTMAFNDEEQMVIDANYADIATYVSRMEAEFITGVSDLTKDWDAYVGQVKDMGIDKV
ncbi:MAG: hypothetical protein GX810_00220, partial [Clostridiales bacterium]|nr:hypothetical protein [Clostridiales bacterium]